MSMKVSDIFNLYQGNSFELQNMNVSDSSSINFVSRASTHNGVTGVVDIIEDCPPFEAGLITVALSGNGVCSTFIQTSPFYTAYHVMVMKPKQAMTFNEKLYYAMCIKSMCIKSNAYRYAWGRQANKTLKDLDLPDEIPGWVNTINVSPIRTSISEKAIELHSVPWSEYKLSSLFKILKGKRLIKEDMINGSTNFIGAISENNGVRQKLEANTNDIWQPNCITVNYNGSVGEAFYQFEPFWASDDVNILYANGWEMNKFNALFIITVIKANKYRFSYGRKWTQEKMKDTYIKLPSTKANKPDFEFMESYIKSLPYSDKIGQ